MDTIPVFVGLDYHQSAVQVCVVDQAGRVLGNRRCANAMAEVAAYAQQFGAVQRVAVESCSGAADFAEELIAQAGWVVDLAHPGFVARMRHNPDKTDYSDARVLADLIRVGYLPTVWLAPEPVRELRLLVRHRQQFANERRATKLRIGAIVREQRCLDAPAAKWTKAWVEWLRHAAALSVQGRWVILRHLDTLQRLAADMKEVQLRLAVLTREDRVVQALLQEPGIGPVTAWMLRAEIGRFDRFHNGKQLARFCGLSPRNASSGTRQADAGLIKAANGELRACLIEAAHRLARTQLRWQLMAAALRARGKPGSLVAAAVANRWIRNLHHRMVA
jgi:transposase